MERSVDLLATSRGIANSERGVAQTTCRKVDHLNLKTLLRCLKLSNSKKGTTLIGSENKQLHIPLWHGVSCEYLDLVLTDTTQEYAQLPLKFGWNPPTIS